MMQELNYTETVQLKCKWFRGSNQQQFKQIDNLSASSYQPSIDDIDFRCTPAAPILLFWAQYVHPRMQLHAAPSPSMLRSSGPGCSVSSPHPADGIAPLLLVSSKSLAPPCQRGSAQVPLLRLHPLVWVHAHFGYHWPSFI